ncbi:MULTISPECIES: signal peptidase I [Bacillus]|uniref:signal peptidase I n=1 Tax=Bacillus TaxID=1386 RepID=UPI0002D94A40|nr:MULTISPECIES: signal peptidase I [Bacillus]
MSESKKNILAEWLKAGVLGIILILFIRTFIFSSYDVDGISMQPTLQDGDKLIVNKLSYEFSSFSRFDVIVFHHSSDEDFVKRVIGLPGDSIQYEDDQLIVNGKKIEEPFLPKKHHLLLGQKETGDFSLKEITGKDRVPDNCLFVMGDNRLGSFDSRHFGFVSMDQVVGKVNVRYWPLDEFYIEL